MPSSSKTFLTWLHVVKWFFLTMDRVLWSSTLVVIHSLSGHLLLLSCCYIIPFLKNVLNCCWPSSAVAVQFSRLCDGGSEKLLCQCEMFSPCVAAKLCAASQDRQTDRQGISDVFTICSGRTDMMGDDREERHFHGVRRDRWGVAEDLLPDINHHLQQRPVKHCCIIYGTLSCLTWNKGQGLLVILSSL